MYSDFSIAIHKLDPTPNTALPFTMKPGKRRPMLASRLLVPAAGDADVSGMLFGVGWWAPKKPSINDCVLVSVGYVDGSLRWQSFDGKKHGVRCVICVCACVHVRAHVCACVNFVAALTHLRPSQC